MDTSPPARVPPYRSLRAGALVAAYVLAALVALIVAHLTPGRLAGSFLREAGRAAGLVGFSLLALQVVLAARLRLVDRAFGLDRVMRFHRAMGVVTVVLLLAHPVLLALDIGSAHLFSFETGWRVNLGKASLALLVFAVIAMICCARRVDYLIRRFLHSRAPPLAVFLGAAHGLVIGSDLRASAVLRGWWWVLIVLTATTVLYRELYVRFRGRRRFRVSDVKRETHDTWTLALVPEAVDRFDYLPGQFVFLDLRRPGRRSEEHPFTVSSSPTLEGCITVTPKESGDFTRTMGGTRPGDHALVEGPLGSFSFLLHEPESFVFIAGGVGITPIMSMLRFLRDTGDERPAILIYGSKKERDIIFRDELGRMPAHVKIVHVLSEPDPDWKGETGFVTREVIENHANPLAGNADFYVCGPPPMTRMVIPALKAMSVRRKRTHHERFSL